MKIHKPSSPVRKPELLVWCACIVTLLTSCSPLYVPSTRTLNHFSTKHEVNAAGMIDLSGFEGRAAYSVTDHFAVSSSFSKSIKGLANDRDTTSIGGLEGSHKHIMLQLGVGYFGKILNHPIEFNGGYSRGKSTTYADFPSHDDAENPRAGTYPSRYIHGAYNRFFIQGGTVVVKNEKATLGVVINVSAVKFSRIESKTEMFVFDKRNQYYFLEPALDLRINTGIPLYVFFNAGFSRRIDNIPRASTNRGSVPETWAINNTLGIGLHFNNTASRHRE